MTPDEMQAALAKLDLSPAALAKLLGVDIRTTRRWATGGKPIPDAIAAQLTAMVAAGGIPPELVEQRRKVEPEEIARFLWVRRKGELEWTVAEHDLIADVYFLPGRIERYAASELVLGPAIGVPE